MQRLLLTLGLTLAAAPVLADYSVKEVGSFHVGGRQETLAGLPIREIVFTPGAPPIKSDPNGDFEVEQMYVQFVKLSQPKAKYPILMWHGGGLSGVTWETKPDGQPGWQQSFLNAGYETYVSDAVERGRASWARFPEIYKSEPFFRAKKEGWELFRIGPAFDKREAFAGTQFPVDAYDQFAKQAVPRWSTNDAATQKAYDALVQKACPCIVMAHSQGANFAFNAALNAPDKIKAVVLIEPSGAPDATKVDVSKVKSIPHLTVWGDNMDKVAIWSRIVATPNKYLDAAKAAGVKVDIDDLPAAGIKGNSHMLMMDKNSDQIAKRVQDWLAAQGMMK
jgi:pimeloyl-ACP methyl ester carboxylesterase